MVKRAVAEFSSSSPSIKESGHAGTGSAPVDVLVLAALEDELDAVLALGDGWEELRDGRGFPYHRGVFPSESGPLVIAAAWLGSMGEVGVVLRGAPLVTELDPVCLAMCGICAGRRGKVALGDVIVADRLYSYDHGKIIARPGEPTVFRHDVRTFNLRPLWRMGAAALKREIDLPALQARRPPSKEAQRRWLLHRLYAHEVEGGPAPVGLADRKGPVPRVAAGASREPSRRALVSLDGGALSLTAAAGSSVLDDRTLYPDELPVDADLQVVVGAIATGKTVQRIRTCSPGWSLNRETVGVETRRAPPPGSWRGTSRRGGSSSRPLSDHADDQRRTTRFRRKFGLRAASAEVLLAFLCKHRRSGAAGAGALRARRGRRARASRAAPLPREPHGRSPARVATVTALRDPDASLAWRRAPAPFAGVIEIVRLERSGPGVSASWAPSIRR